MALILPICDLEVIGLSYLKSPGKGEGEALCF